MLLARLARRRHGREERGSVSTELVIATPLLLLLVMGVIQFALWQHASHVARTVAQQGVAAARVDGASAATGQDEAHTVLAQLGANELRNAHITTTRDGNTTTVVVTGEASSVLPFFHLPVRAVATGPTERFRPAVNSP